MNELFAVFALLSVVVIGKDGRYAEGQVWSYRTRFGEEGSTLQINKIDDDQKLGPIFHISVFEVRVKNPYAPEGSVIELPHFPVSKETLDKSVVALSKTPARKVAYEEGYSHWKREFDAGRAGVFSASVAEIVAGVEATIAKGSHGDSSN